MHRSEMDAKEALGRLLIGRHPTLGSAGLTVLEFVRNGKHLHFQMERDGLSLPERLGFAMAAASYIPVLAELITRYDRVLDQARTVVEASRDRRPEEIEELRKLVKQFDSTRM